MTWNVKPWMLMVIGLAIGVLLAWVRHRAN
jgi:hypothetical protein